MKRDKMSTDFHKRGLQETGSPEMKEDRIEIPKPKGHCCFACGTANPIGLNLQFYLHGEHLCTDITLDRNYEGWENMVHGGILSTLLDEVMSWTIIVFKRVFFVTRKMEVKYIRPVTIGTPVTVKGRLVDGSRPPRIRARAEVLDGGGTVLARSTGEFVILPEERLSVVPEGLKKDMNDLFEGLENIERRINHEVPKRTTHNRQRTNL
jgi:uncharacterized protein (TIGR00369 family)